MSRVPPPKKGPCGAVFAERLSTGDDTKKPLKLFTWDDRLSRDSESSVIDHHGAKGIQALKVNRVVNLEKRQK